DVVKTLDAIAEKILTTELHCSTYLGQVHRSSGYQHDDEPERCVVLFMVLSFIIDALTHFGMSDYSVHHNSLILEVSIRIQASIELHNMKRVYDRSTETTFDEAFVNELHAAWTLFLEAGPHKHTCSEDSVVVTISGRLRQEQSTISSDIYQMLVDMLSVGLPFTAVVFARLQDTQELFPDKCKDLIRSLPVIERCRDVHGLRQQGKAGGALFTLAKLCDEVRVVNAKCPEAAAARDDIVDWIAAAGAEFEKALNSLCQKMNVSKTMSDFEKHDAVAVTAIEAWDFTQCERLRSDAEVPQHVVNIAKKLELAANQWPTWQHLLESTVQQCKDWLVGPTRDALQNALDSVPATGEAVRKRAVIFGAALVASRMLTTDGNKKAIDGTLDYVKNKLLVAEADLPQALLKRLRTGLQGKKGADAATAAPEPEASQKAAASSTLGLPLKKLAKGSSTDS
ncbi:unnamed protein product, partial [Prorocentrum cordatum]